MGAKGVGQNERPVDALTCCRWQINSDADPNRVGIFVKARRQKMAFWKITIVETEKTSVTTKTTNSILAEYEYGYSKVKEVLASNFY